MEKIRQSIIDEMLRNNTIISYLTSKGIEIIRAGKYVKCSCPLHNEKTPSFVIYTGTDGIENYSCFGCKSSGNLITLYMAMEHVSYKDALTILVKDIDLSDDQELDLIIKNIQKQEKSFVENNGSDILAEFSLNFGALCFGALKTMEFDKEMYDFLEQMYKMIDKWIRVHDFGSLDTAYNMLTKDRLLNQKINEWQQKQKIKRQKEIENQVVNDERK